MGALVCWSTKEILNLGYEEPGPLHLFHLGDALLEVAHEALLVVKPPAAAGCGQSARVSLLELNPELVVLRAEHGDA